MFDHFVGLGLKGLILNLHTACSSAYLKHFGGGGELQLPLPKSEYPDIKQIEKYANASPWLFFGNVSKSGKWSHHLTQFSRKRTDLTFNFTSRLQTLKIGQFHPQFFGH